MAAQANKLSTVADNIANSGTTGYKRASTEFAALVSGNSTSEYNAGGVTSTIRYSITAQGTLAATSSATDLAIQGNGFFVVGTTDGASYLTRAGSFVPDADGFLINTAGYYLMGYDLSQGSPNVTANSLAGLTKIQLPTTGLLASPSSSGTFAANLPSSSTAVAAANLPSANASTATYTEKTSLIAYDSLGGEEKLDVYMTMTGANTWEVSVFNNATAATGGGFPYTSAALATQTLTFDSTTGQLATSSANSITFTVPGGQSLKLDLSNMTQLNADYSLSAAKIDGNAASSLDHVEIATDGTLYAVLENGTRIAAYQIPLATVTSPDNLTPVAGNAYALSMDSGDVLQGFAGSSGFGLIKSDNLESSTVDLATELTDMIQAQRNYTANSKVFQTGGDLLDVLVNLKR
jgi:flagellar hook protein FlgE